MKSLSRAQLLATPWTRAYEAAPSTGFSRQEYWSGVPTCQNTVLLQKQWFNILGHKQLAEAQYVSMELLRDREWERPIQEPALKELQGTVPKLLPKGHQRPLAELSSFIQ